MRGEGSGEGEMGLWGEETHKVDEHRSGVYRELEPLSCNNFKWNITYKNIESVCCTLENNKIL